MTRSSTPSRAVDVAICHLPSPVGELRLAADADGLVGVLFERHAHEPWGAEGWRVTPGDSSVLAAARAQLAAYFAGELTEFDLPLAARGTPFQTRVWTSLRAIPFGETVSYAAIAARLDAPTATRAVGAANGRNPISIVVPCHRVVGADGSLTGFGGGIDRKRWLLHHEAAVLARRSRARS